MTEFWRDLVLSALRNLGLTLVAVVPSILAMLTLVGLGLLLGWVLGALILRLAGAVRLDERSRSWGLTAALIRGGIGRSPSHVLRLVVFWGTFMIFATMGIEALALPGVPGATGLLMGFLTRALAALLIVVVGMLIANFLGHAVLVGAVNAGLPEAGLLARVTRWSVLLFTVATALTEVGIGRDMVLIAFGITFGGLVLALALAFGIGGRTVARRLLEQRFGGPRESPPHETLSHL
jgi:hypothetical protein